MEEEFSDLVPLFVEESRERLDRLALCVPRLAEDPQAAVEARRELHTLKGAGRMMRLGAFAELCHAAEEPLHGLRHEAPATAGLIPLMMRVLDRLSAMIDAVKRGDGEVAPDGELIAVLARTVAGGGPAAAPAPAGVAGASAAGVAGGGAAGGGAVSGGAAGAGAVSTGASGAGAAGAGAAGDIRVDSQILDTVAERATEVRILALAARPVAERLHELARLAEEGVREPQPGQVLAVLATMLRRAAGDLEGGQRRLLRAAESQLDRMLALQLQPLRGSLLALARYARELGRSLKREI